MHTTVTEPEAEKRQQRWNLHRYLRTVSVRPGGRGCMSPAPTSSVVTVSRTAAGVVHVDGVQRCASPWSCPVCAPVIRERRAGEIESAVAAALARGWHVYFVTATVSHRLGDHLSDVLSLVTSAWSATFSGRTQEALQAAGYQGQVRAIEVTHGSNGWHPHVHALLFFDRPWDPGKATIVRGRGRARDVHRLADVFADHADRLGGFSDVRSVLSPGWTVRTVANHTGGTMAGYLTKVQGGWSAGHEVARTDVKAGRRKSSVAPFTLLARAAEGDAQAKRLWRVYETATIGRRAIVWTRGLLALLTGCDEVDDDEAATVAPDELVEVVATFSREAWLGLLAAGKVWRILECARWDGPVQPPSG